MLEVTLAEDLVQLPPVIVGSSELAEPMSDWVQDSIVCSYGVHVNIAAN